MNIKKVLWAILVLLIVISIFSLFASLFVGSFHLGLSKIKKIDEKYSVSLKEYPIDFTQINQMPLTITDITFMSNEFKALKENSKDEALLRYLNFRMSLLEAEMNYKLAFALGKKGDTSDGFGCKDKPVIIEAASYKNMSAQIGYAAVEHLKTFFEQYPKQAALTEVPQSWPVFLNVSFSEIERKSGSTIRFIKRICPDK